MRTRAYMPGFTLLEILIAVLLLAFGIVGGVAMQLSALRARHQHHPSRDGGRGYRISSPLFDWLLGTLASGAVDVSTGATLGGSGAIGGTTTVFGVLSPGNSPGVLSVATLVLGGSSTSVFEIEGTTRGTQYDGLNITGSSGPTYGGALSLVFGNGSAFGNTDEFNLFDFTGAPTADFSSVTSTGFYSGTWSVSSGEWSLQSGGQTLTFSQSAGDLVIVPEPTALALTGIGIAAAAWARRWRR